MVKTRGEVDNRAGLVGETLEWVRSSGEQREKVRLEPSMKVRERRGPGKPILRLGEKGGLLEEGLGVIRDAAASWSLLGG